MAHYYDESLKRPASFNFASDVVDYWAQNGDEAKCAMHWVTGDLQQESRLSFGHFSQQSHRIAVLLREKLRIQSGDRLLIITPRVPLWWEISTGALRCGVVVCPATTLLVDKDIEYRANRSGASIFIGDEVSVQKLLKVRDRCPKIKHVLQIGASQTSQDVISFEELLRSIPKDMKYTGSKPNVKDASMIYL